MELPPEALHRTFRKSGCLPDFHCRNEGSAQDLLPQRIDYDILEFGCRKTTYTNLPGHRHPLQYQPNNAPNPTKSMSKPLPVGQLETVGIQGRNLEILRIAGDPALPELVFLHEGLGSVSHWRDFPAKVAAATGCPVMIYSRYGSGNSDVLAEPRTVRYMHHEALDTLPALLSALSIRNPILVGHSDGASIAIVYAGAHDSLRGLALLAPHVFVEELSIRSIAKAKTTFESTNLPELLARHHRDAARTFWGWNDIWLHPEFRQWNIEEYLPRITCPALVIQGLEDQYGTMAQVDAIRKQVAGAVDVLMLEDCKHSPQRDQPEAVLEAIRKFVEKFDRLRVH